MPRRRSFRNAAECSGGQFVDSIPKFPFPVIPPAPLFFSDIRKKKVKLEFRLSERY
jgi:hypothetical protein